MSEIIRTSYELEVRHAEALRSLAEALGFVQTRGAGAGRLGNVSALLRSLAEADHDKTVAALKMLGVEGKRDA
jgi:protein tyrosine/serine phosphatase